LADGRVFYEPAVGREHHEHLICVECGKILEFVQEEIERLQDEVCREYRFEPQRHTLQIYGTCEACRTGKAEQATAEGTS
jgi:Fur family ferric uptake transcriptional regulator